jgi:hypothetical protein
MERRMPKLTESQLFINGELRDASDGATFPDYSPWTGEEVGRAAELGIEGFWEFLEVKTMGVPL